MDPIKIQRDYVTTLLKTLQQLSKIYGMLTPLIRNRGTRFTMTHALPVLISGLISCPSALHPEPHGQSVPQTQGGFFLLHSGGRLLFTAPSLTQKSPHLGLIYLSPPFHRDRKTNNFFRGHSLFFFLPVTPFPSDEPTLLHSQARGLAGADSRVAWAWPMRTPSRYTGIEDWAQDSI